MAYNIKIRIINDTEDDIRIVAKENQVPSYGKAEWSYMKHGYALRMEASGTSGALMFESTWGEKWVVATGVHNYKRWCDVNTDVGGSNLPAVHKRYFSSNTKEHTNKWKQPTSSKAQTAKGRKLSMVFSEDEGHELAAVFIYGV